MSTTSRRRYTEAQYLAIVRDLETKHEFHRGEMFAMSCASRQHNQITFNLAGILHSQLKNQLCVAFVNDVRARWNRTRAETFGSSITSDNIFVAGKAAREHSQR